MISKNVAAFVVTFIIVFLVSIPSIWPNLQLIDESRLAKTELDYDENLERSMPNFAGIHTLNIPAATANVSQWNVFVNDINRIPREDLVGYKGKHRPLWVFLAYIAKHQPALFMKYVDNDQISINDFDAIVQKGLLQDWVKHSSNINRIIRNGQIALLRLAVNDGQVLAQSMAKRAFLEVSEFSKLTNLNLRNLRFALHSMTSDERQVIGRILLKTNVRFEKTKLYLLDGFFSDEDLLAMSEAQFVDKGSSEKRHEINEAMWGNPDSVQAMVTAFANATLFKAGEIESGKREWQRNYCVPCALSLHTDGLIGKPLFDAASADDLDITKLDGEFILTHKPYSQKEGL